MSRSNTLDFARYKELETAFKDKMKFNQIESKVANDLFNALCWALRKNQLLKKGKSRWWLENYGIKWDRLGSADYFIEVLSLLDSQELLSYIDGECDAKGLVDKYFFTPGRWGMTSLYFEMKERWYDEGGVYDYYFNEVWKDPYEKCDINIVMDFIHNMEGDMGLWDQNWDRDDWLEYDW